MRKYTTYVRALWIEAEILQQISIVLNSKSHKFSTHKIAAKSALKLEMVESFLIAWNERDLFFIVVEKKQLLNVALFDYLFKIS